MAGKHKTDAGNNASRGARGKIATWLSRHMHFSLFFAIPPRLIDRSCRSRLRISPLSGNIPNLEVRRVAHDSRKIRPAVQPTDRSYLRMLG